MELIIAIDDTDNLDKELISTGRLAELIIEEIQEKNLGTCEPVTRHQLLLHKDIAYTSHNSSMAFVFRGDPKTYDCIRDLVIENLYKHQAPGSDPGLCILKKDEISPREREELIEYGYQAKKIVLNKEIAYKLAEKLNIHLSEHGGTGLGVIGALAGVGLRLGGDDGEFKGTVKLDRSRGPIRARDLLKYDFIDEVRLLDGGQVDLDRPIALGEKYKTILRSSKAVFLIKEDGENYRTCSKKEVRAYGKI